MRKKVLVTGGTGYVGGRLCRYLSASENYDILIATRREKLPFSYPNISHVQVDHSLSSYDHYLEGVHYVIHLAALNERECVDAPSEAIDVNIKQSEKWIRAASSQSIEKFIYFSTVHVYGAPLQGEISETTCPTPFHPYAITHKVVEDYISFYTSRSQMQGIVLRLSNSFGEPVHPDIERWGLAVNDFARQVVANGSIVLNSSGEQKRDFIPLSVVENTVLQLLETNIEDKVTVANLSSGFSKSIYDMACITAAVGEKILEKKIPISRKASDSKGEVQDLEIKRNTLDRIGIEQLDFSFGDEVEALVHFIRQHF